MYRSKVLEEGDAAAAEYARRHIDPRYGRAIGRLVRALKD